MAKLQGRKAEKSEWDSRQRQHTSIFYAAFWPALGPNQPQTQQIPWPLSSEVKCQAKGADHSTVHVTMCAAIPSLPHSLHTNMLKFMHNMTYGGQRVTGTRFSPSIQPSHRCHCTSAPYFNSFLFCWCSTHLSNWQHYWIWIEHCCLFTITCLECE